MSTYGYFAVLSDDGCLQVDGGFYNGNASYSTPSAASAKVCTLQNCVIYPMVSQALPVIDCTTQAETRTFEAGYTLHPIAASWESGLPLGTLSWVIGEILVQRYCPHHRTLFDTTIGTPPRESNVRLPTHQQISP